MSYIAGYALGVLVGFYIGYGWGKQAGIRKATTEMTRIITGGTK